MKTTYVIRQIDAWNDGFWYWNDSFYIGEFKTAAQNVKQPFMKALKKLGISFTRGTVYIAYVGDIGGDILEVRNRKTDEPYFAAIPLDTLNLT